MIESSSYRSLGGTKPLRCLDTDHLALPFFEERHRALARRLDHWLEEREPEIKAVLEQTPQDAGRRFTGLLGRDGWLDWVCSEPLDLRAICLIREGLAYRHDLLDFAFAIQALAAAPLVLWGTDEQKARFLPSFASGRAIGAFAISEREAGSNLSAVALKATRGDAIYKLTGEKSWIANADIADYLLVLARTGNMTGPIGLSVFLVDAREPGVKPEAVELIAPRSFGHLQFNECSVAADQLIGPDGAGLAIALDTLEHYRMSVGAAANGFARRALHEARAHTSTHRIGEDRLIDLPVVRQRIADMAVSIEVARLTVAHAAWDMDKGGESRNIRSSLAKLHATEAAQAVVDNCVQLHGAAGLVRNSMPERLYREIRSMRIYEGTSEIQKIIIGEAVALGTFA